MKIAIPSEDRIHISSHFGRTKGFMIYEIENNEIVKSEYRDNTFTGHARGMHHEHGHNHHEDNHQQHTHGRILNALNDCNTVIAGGMGRRLLDDLNNNGKEVIVTDETQIEKAIQAFLENTLDHSESKCCEH